MCEHHRNIGVESIETDRGLLYPVDGSSALAVNFDYHSGQLAEETVAPKVLEAPAIEAPAVVEEVRENVQLVTEAPVIPEIDISAPAESEKPKVVETVRETVPKVFKRREKREKKSEVRMAPPVQQATAKKDDGDRLLEEINMLAGQGKKLGKKRRGKR